MVTRGSFSTDHGDPRDELFLSLMDRGILNLEISVDDVKDVHKLSLVLVHSLYHNIIKSLYWDIEAGVFLYPLSKSFLSLLLHDDESLHE